MAAWRSGLAKKPAALRWSATAQKEAVSLSDGSLEVPLAKGGGGVR